MLVQKLASAILVTAGLSVSCAALAQPAPEGRYHETHDEAVECASHNENYQRCEVPWSDARLARTLSDTQCVRGENWGFDRRRGFIWVDKGCRARFIASGPTQRPEYGNEWRPGPEWDHRFSVTCESTDSRPRFCAVDAGGGGRVTLERQLSSAACVEGESWGWNRGGVWVSRGCRATFSIDRRWH